MPSATCVARMHDGKTCGRASYGTSGAPCLFHAPGPKPADVFQSAFEGIVRSSPAGLLDCTGFVFPDTRLHDVAFPVHAIFRECRFVGKTTWSSCTFAQGVDFLGSRFEGPTSFHKSLFRMPCTFQRTTFASVADFGGCTFEGGCDFGSTTFRERVYFTSARFVPSGDPQSTPYFVFIDAIFEGQTDFTFATFHGTASFRAARFNDVASFSNIRLEGPLPGPGRWTIPQEELLDFSHARVERPDGVRFIGPSVSGGSLDLSRLRLGGADVSRMQFADARWGPTGGVDEGQVVDEHLRTEDPFGTRSLDNASGERLALIYKGLRESYERHLMFREAGRFHEREMECRRRAHAAWLEARVEHSRGLRRLERTLALHIRRQVNLLNAYRITSGYGERPARAFAAIASWFALMGLLSLVDLPSGPALLQPWTDSVLDLMPSTVAGATWVEFIARVGGVFLIAGFIIALRRHFRR